MRHLDRVLFVLGVSLVALFASAIPSSAADATDAVSAAEVAAAPAAGAQDAADDGLAVRPDSRNRSDAPGATLAEGANVNRGGKYAETQNITKRWWWWQQQDFNDNNDFPDDGGDDGFGTNGGDDDSDDDSADDDNASVIICHCPPGNPNNCKTKSVGEPAVDAHLGHGDTLGPCPDDETPSDPDD